MSKKDELSAEKEALAGGINSPFWKALSNRIDINSNTDLFLAIKTEMGMKGFWYMKGYIQSMRDIQKIVNSASKKTAPLE